MSDPATDEIMGRISDGIRHAMEEAGNDAADDLRELISIPVVRTKGKVIRSSPGQPPRKDTGALLASVKSVIDEIEKDRIAVTISTDTDYDQFLKNGTARMAARPFDGPIETKWEPIIENRLGIAARQIS